MTRPTTSYRLGFSWHALERMAEMGIDREMVADTVADLYMTWPAHSGRVHIGGPKIIVVLAPETNTVVTVKLRTTTPYIHGVHTITNLPGNQPAAA